MLLFCQVCTKFVGRNLLTSCWYFDILAPVVCCIRLPFVWLNSSQQVIPSPIVFYVTLKKQCWNEEIRKKPRIFMHVPHQHCCVRMHVQSWSLFNARLFRRTQLNSIDFQNRYFLKYTVATRYSQYISKCNIYIQMEIVSAWNWLPKSWTTAVILDNVDSYQPKAWCINIWRETECCQCPPSLPLSHTKSFGNRNVRRSNIRKCSYVRWEIGNAKWILGVSPFRLQTSFAWVVKRLMIGIAVCTDRMPAKPHLLLNAISKFDFFDSL